MLTSVVIATYNGEKFIRQQIDSILTQLDDNDEIVISDNNSTDETVNIIQSYGDERIKLYIHLEKGVITNFENALKHASGDLIFLADQDDIWLENKVTVMKKYLEEYDLVMSDCCIVNSNLQIINDSFYSLVNAGKGLFKNFKRNTYQGSNMAFKRKILQLALPFPSKIPMHDIWIAFIGELFYKTIFVPQKLSLYRRHTNNVSSSTQKSKYSVLAKLKFRLWLLQQVPLLLYKKVAKNK